MKRLLDQYIQDILESIEWIEKDTKGLTKTTFVENVPMQDALSDAYRLLVRQSRTYLMSSEALIQKYHGRILLA